MKNAIGPAKSSVSASPGIVLYLACCCAKFFLFAKFRKPIVDPIAAKQRIKYTAIVTCIRMLVYNMDS